MPCNDYYDPPHYADSLKYQAILCGVLTASEKMHGSLTPLLDQVDWLEVGVFWTDVVQWFREHQKRDSERRAYQAEQKRETELRNSALAKLTAEERLALKL